MILRQPYNASKSLTKASRCGQVRLASIAAVARQRGGKPKRMKAEEGDMAAVEHGLSVSRLADLGQLGNPEIDLHNQPLELLDLTLPPPRLWPSKFAPGSSLPARVLATFQHFFSTIRPNLVWSNNGAGVVSVFKSARSMWSLAANKSFYTAPSRPPWSSLPSHALSPELFAALPSAPELRNISEQVGTFIPLHSQSIDVRMRDPSTVIGRPVKVGTIRGYPYSIAKMLRYDSIRSRPKGKEDWIEGFRWSCMESYLKHLYAFSIADTKSLKLVTTDEYQGTLFTSLRRRKRAETAQIPSVVRSMNKPSWNTIASRPSGTSFKWKFHGVGDGAAGCHIKALRAQEAYNGVATPPINNPLMVQCLVSFDTIQSLQVYEGDKMIREEGPRRVREDLVMEKKMYYPLPWAVKRRFLDSDGVTPVLTSVF